MDDFELEKLYYSIPEDFRSAYTLLDFYLAVALLDSCCEILKDLLLSN